LIIDSREARRSQTLYKIEGQWNSRFGGTLPDEYGQGLLLRGFGGGAAVDASAGGWI
jgi:hypothetical protein